MRKLALSLFIAPVLVGCSDISDPAISSGFGALDGAYASDVKPSDATYTRCAYRLIDTRHVARCGISFGGTQLAQVGYWEIERRGESFTAYAMNGKALSALERINRPGSLSNVGYPGAFKSGQGRAPLDIAKSDAAFK